MPQPAHLSLRSLSLQDAPAITALLAGDTELALQTATIPIPYTIHNAQAFLSNADPQLIFAITIEDQLVGMVGMGSTEPVEIGYWVGRKHWGKGCASSALALLCEEARRQGITILEAEVFPANLASMRVLEKNKFKRVREVQKDMPQRGGLRTLIRFRREL